MIVTCRVADGHIPKDKALTPTWVNTASFGNHEAATMYISLVRRYNWTSLYMFVDQWTTELFYEVAETVRDEFMARSDYQITYDIVDCANMSDIDDSLNQYADCSRSKLQIMDHFEVAGQAGTRYLGYNIRFSRFSSAVFWQCNKF